MTLNIQSQEDEQRQLIMTVEVPEDRVQKAMRQTAKRSASKLAIPGFRRGKAPYNVVVRYLGEDALRAEAVDNMFQEVFQEALESIEAAPYMQPSLDNMELEPLVMTFTIPLEPTVVLGDYRSIRKLVPPVEVTEEALQEALERIQQRHQVLEPVDRPVAEGDMVTLSGQGVVLSEEGGTREVIFEEERLDMVMSGDNLWYGQPFVDAIVGLSAGDQKSFELEFEADFTDEELAGRKADFDITVLDVKSRELPDLDDDLAQEEGDYETLDELQEALQEQLQSQAERQARSDLVDGMVDDLLVDANILFPPAALDTELQGMLDNYRQQVVSSGWQWEDFLRLQNETEAGLKDKWGERAKESLRRRLVLSEFVSDERIRLQSEELDAAIEERIAQFDKDELQDQMREWLQTGSGAEMVANEVLMDKVYQRIVDIVTGQAPDLDALEAAELAAQEEEE